MRRRSTSYLLYALLVFQLTMGMIWPVAQAVTVLNQSQTAGMEMAHCPEHTSSVSDTANLHPSHHAQPLTKQDCCRSAGCQCHCASTPGVAGPTGLRIFTSFGFVLPTLDARVTTTRPDEILRPPIT